LQRRNFVALKSGPINPLNTVKQDTSHYKTALLNLTLNQSVIPEEERKEERKTSALNKLRNMAQNLTGGAQA
jgi:hypothetical protein